MLFNQISMKLSTNNSLKKITVLDNKSVADNSGNMTDSEKQKTVAENSLASELPEVEDPASRFICDSCQ